MQSNPPAARPARRRRRGCLVTVLVVLGLLVALFVVVLDAGLRRSGEQAGPKHKPTPRVTVPADGDDPIGVPEGILYYANNELYIDDEALGVETHGPARWRPDHPDELTYIRHSDPMRSRVFLFERVYLYNLETGEERVILDIDDHGWSEAGHNDWDASGERMVFAAKDDSGEFKPYVVDVATGEVEAVGTETQVIDTVFAPDGRILGVDTTEAEDSYEPIAWIGDDGSVEPLESSVGVNRDPAVSPNSRYLANIRASGLLARLFVGRWDLVVTDLQSGVEWAIGDGDVGFGPPRWVDDRTVVAWHASYNSLGVISSIDGIAAIDVIDGTVTDLGSLSNDAWNPDAIPE